MVRCFTPQQPHAHTLPLTTYNKMSRTATVLRSLHLASRQMHHASLYAPCASKPIPFILAQSACTPHTPTYSLDACFSRQAHTIDRADATHRRV